LFFFSLWGGTIDTFATDTTFRTGHCQPQPERLSTEPFLVPGPAPENFCLGAAWRRKIVQTSWHKAYSEYPLFTHKVRTRYPQALALQRPQDRIILYPQCSKPLDIGFERKSQTQLSTEIQALFPTELTVVSPAKPLQRKIGEQQLSGLLASSAHSL
jgi:hypothetical protein